MLERKIPDNLTKNQSVNLNDFEGHKRLSPRKHLSSQSLLSMSTQAPMRTRNSPKKHLKNLADSLNQSLPTSSVETSKNVEDCGLLNGVTKQINEALICHNSGKSDSGLRHSPRLQCKSVTNNVQVKQDIDNMSGNMQDLNLKTVSDSNQVPSTDGRNIFSKLQFEVDELQGLTCVKTESLSRAAEKRKLDIQGCHNKPDTEEKTEKTLTPEMPLLTPFDSEPVTDFMISNSVNKNSQVHYGTENCSGNQQCIPPLSPSIKTETVNSGPNSSGKHKRIGVPPAAVSSAHLRKSPRKKLRSVEKKSVKVTETDGSIEQGQPLLENPRKRLRSNSGQASDIASVSIGANIKQELDHVENLTSEYPSKLKKQSKVKEETMDSLNNTEQVVGPTLRTRSHSKDNSKAVLSNSGPKNCDTNVFETFNSSVYAAGVSDIGSCHSQCKQDASTNIFESFTKKLVLSETKSTPQNGHIGKKSLNRKRRLSFDGMIKSPTYHKSCRKKKFSLDGNTPKRDTSSRNIFADLSPRKIPRITIKMPRDPVLLKELANQHSDSVHFKLESPQPSVPGTPNDSDSSDSDEEESPLNCTKFKPINRNNLTPGGFSMKTSQFYSNSGNNYCPKLMRIKLGDTHIDINIPQCGDRT